MVGGMRDYGFIWQQIQIFQYEMWFAIKSSTIQKYYISGGPGISAVLKYRSP